MLRIKKDVDLKDLEKFVFVKCPEKMWEDYIYAPDGYEFDDEEYTDKSFYIKNREIVWEYEMYGEELNWLLYVLFDLIQAGLVEKVEEE